jgi:polar amino acid transport system permease protein
MLELIPLFNRAALMTVYLTALGVFFSLVVGVLGNLAYYYRIKFFTGIAKAYTELSRNTPLLAHLFFLFYGLPVLGIMFSGFVCGVIALTFLGGSYMMEAIRGGIEAVSKTQKESALSLGLSRTQMLIHIISPQALRTAMASLSANVIFLLRESSLIGVIAVPQLMQIATSQIGMFFRTDEVLIMLTAYYLLLIGPLSLLFIMIERRLRHGWRRNAVAK